MLEKFLLVVMGQAISGSNPFQHQFRMRRYPVEVAVLAVTQLS